MPALTGMHLRISGHTRFPCDMAQASKSNVCVWTEKPIM